MWIREYILLFLICCTLPSEFAGRNTAVLCLLYNNRAQTYDKKMYGL